MSKADHCTTPIRSRRAVLAGIAVTAAVPIAAAAPACGLKGKMAATGYELPDIGSTDDKQAEG